MDYEEIEALRERHPAWRLLRAGNAPLLLSYLGWHFIEENCGATLAGELWGREERPTSVSLGGLDAEEAAIYDDLVGDRYGEGIRLEQERIDCAWVRARLPYTPAQA